MATAYELGHALGMEKAALDPSTLQALIGGGAGAGLGGLGGYLLSDEDKLRNTLLGALAGGGAGAGLGYYRGRAGEEEATRVATEQSLGKEEQISGLLRDIGKQRESYGTPAEIWNKGWEAAMGVYRKR